MGKNSRRADGEPETAKDKKFFDLRESGFKGPIDQDGDPVMTEIDSKGNPKPLFGRGKS